MAYPLLTSLFTAIVAANPDALYLSVLTVFLLVWVAVYGLMLAFGTMALLLLRDEFDRGWIERKVLSLFTLPPFSLSLILCLKVIDLTGAEVLSLVVSGVFVLAHAHAATTFLELQFELLHRRFAGRKG